MGDKRILISLTSRLYSDEVSALQAYIGAVVCLKESHAIQSVKALGLAPIMGDGCNIDYMQAVFYLSKCTLAVLEEVGPDTLVLVKLEPNEQYLFKNVYKPHFHWDSHCELAVIPPLFGVEQSSVSIQSNDIDLIFPMVVPRPLALMVLQKLLLYNIYASNGLSEEEMLQVSAYTNNISYMGRSYSIQLRGQNPGTTLHLLDDLVIHTCVLSNLIPRACFRLLENLVRYNQHPMVDVFSGVVPVETLDIIQREPINIGDDIVRMGAFMSHIISLATVFNSGPKLRIAAYTSDTLTATGWLIP